MERKLYLTQADVDKIKARAGKRVHFAQYLLAHLKQDENGWLLDEELAKDRHLIENVEHIIGRDFPPPPMPKRESWPERDYGRLPYEDEGVILSKKKQGGLPSPKIINKLFAQVKSNDVVNLRKTLEFATMSEVNSLNAKGVTPLILAASMKKYEIVELLLEEGADANTHKEGVMSALEAAIVNDDFDTAIILLDYDADPDDGSEPGAPLIIACQHENEKLVETLLDYNADPDVKVIGFDVKSLTPLSVCATKNNLEIGRILLEVGALPVVLDENVLSEEFKAMLEEYDSIFED